MTALVDLEELKRLMESATSVESMPQPWDDDRHYSDREVVRLCADRALMASIPALIAELEAAREELAPLERILTVCVVLPPATTIVAGCKIRTVVAGLSADYRSALPGKESA